MSDSFDIKADARSYEVSIQAGAAMEHLRSLGGGTLAICDEIFADRYKNLSCLVMSVPALESRKTLDEAARLVEAARAAGFTRSGKIVAVGGGIIQDVACFVASIFMRGVGWSYLPTTVLGMVDSCVGGKSSINVGKYKNLAGTIHPPDRVLVDPGFAQTLTIDHFAGGLCEAAKICYARGGGVFNDYLALEARPSMNAAALAEVVLLSLKAKRWFIEIDEFDRKERLTLNFGHTFGHAIESASNYAINHGAAVGVGMLCALEFASARGMIGHDVLLERLREHTLALLETVPDLPTEFARLDMSGFEQALLSDKKHTPDRLTLVLPASSSENGLPLDLCRLPRDADVLGDLSRAVERTQRMIAG